jgi:hypothetical protein
MELERNSAGLAARAGPVMYRETSFIWVTSFLGALVGGEGLALIRRDARR